MASPEAEESPMALFKKRGPKKSTIRKRAATPSDASSGSEYSTDDEQGQRVKRRRKGGGVVLGTNVNAAAQPVDTSKNSKFAADRSAAIAASDDATKQSNWFEEPSAKALLGTSRNKTSAAPKSTITYDTSALEKKNFTGGNKDADGQSISRQQAKGPVKAPTNIRTVTTMDYTPNVCKDYLKTGWCGYGDSCIYAHYREAFAQGWQLDKEWELAGKGKKPGGTVVSSRNRNTNGNEEDEKEMAMLKDIPFVCLICEGDYKNPIMTRCNHYFCEACALKRFKKTPTCAQCGAGTGGVFNDAKNLKKLLQKKREREERAKEKAAEEEGEDDKAG